MIINNEFNNLISNPVRYVSAEVGLYNGSTLEQTFNQYYALKNLTIERVGDKSKFFGFGICQKVNIHLIDNERYLNITTANSLAVSFGVGAVAPIQIAPSFYVTEVHRDENTNELSITAYDALYSATNHTVEELHLGDIPEDGGAIFALDLASIADSISEKIGIYNTVIPEDIEAFYSDVYLYGGNFEGTETLRQALDAIAEATQTIYYINHLNELVFKRLDKEGATALTIGRESYITLKSGENRRLAKIVHSTELGDNVSASLTETGSTQYIRDNPFWTYRNTDIEAKLEGALAAAGGLTINQFECEWRGNPLLEIGDKIALITKDNNTVYSYLLDDSISYDGSLKQDSKWQYESDEAESAENPTSLGDALKQTYTRVDKANKEIQLVTSETAANSEAISSLQLDTESISASVSSMEETTREALEGINDGLSTLTSRVDAAITSEDVTIAIQSELMNGVDKVTTSTGFTFNEEGLTVSKSESEMKTTITEDGMTVYKNDEAVLVANNIGVNAVNLHATTYLIIGANSRFEDYGSDRTGCFWIGN